MSAIDPNMAMLYSTLAGSAMAPMTGDAAPGIDDIYKRRMAQQSSARTTPQDTARPLTQHLMSQAAMNLGQQSMAPRPPQPQQPMMPARTQASPAGYHEEDYNPAGVPLGNVANGRNVELIKGGHSEVQHFGTEGTNEGVIQPQTPAPAAKPIKPQTFNQANEQQIFQYREAERQMNHLDSQLNGTNGMMLDESQKTALMNQKNALHQQMSGLGQKLAGWSPEEEPARQREMAANQEVEEASKTIHQPIPMQQTAQGNPPLGQIPHAPKPGSRLTPEVIDAISKVAKTREEAEAMAKQAGWSF